MAVSNLNKKHMIKNLTPHPIRVRLSVSTLSEPDPTDLIFPSEGSARVKTSSRVVDECGGVSVISTEYGEVEGLPDPTPGVTYLVSFMVAAAARGRTDLLGPATGPADGVIRDTKGQIFAVRAFQRA